MEACHCWLLVKLAALIATVSTMISFDNFGGDDYVSEDDNEDVVIPKWILDGRRFVEIKDKDEDHKDDYSHDLCMVNYGVNFKFPWTTQETASLKLEPDGCKLDNKSIQSDSTTSKNYYSCLSEDESEAVVIAKPIGLGRWTPGKRWTKPRPTNNNNNNKKTKKINKKPARNNTERPRRMKYGGRQWYKQPTVSDEQLKLIKMERLFQLVLQQLKGFTQEPVLVSLLVPGWRKRILLARHGWPTVAHPVIWEILTRVCSTSP
jgi:hypothetical protein